MRASRVVATLVFLALAAWTLWLRWPGLEHRVWNLDEAIHSAVADRLLDGGVLYRDAIDQRTPLSYYVVAAVYAVAGRNNIFALHFFTALLIAATAFLLWRFARCWRHGSAGAWAAALFATLSSTALYAGDAFAFNTEWLVAFFTSAAALLFLCASERGEHRWFVGAGAALGLAFLSKQPALLDAAAPVMALAYLAWRRPEQRRALPAQLASLAAGWLAPVALVALYLALRGALADAIYYAWTYNISIYGPEISTGARLASVTTFWSVLADGAPAVLGWLLVAAALAAFRLVQRDSTPGETRDNPFVAYVVAWSATGLAGAISGGRGFEHYLIQALPPFCLLAGWLLGRTVALARSAHCRLVARVVAGLALACTVFDLVEPIPATRARTLPPDVSARAAALIGRVTPRDEKIFVWGYHPEFYLFSGRSPASRFVYASFLTGMVPWTNTAADRDTTYAIVPGAMETLLGELAAQRPTFFVDCSVGPNRFWQKYPLAKFPALKAFVDANYLLVDPEQFRGHGFDLYLLKDSGRRQPIERHGPPVQLGTPQVWSPDTFTSEPNTVMLVGSSADARLTGLQLVVDGAVHTAVSFAPVDSLKVTVPVQFEPDKSRGHTLQVRAIGADGSVVEGSPRTVTVSEGRLNPAEAAAFTLPQIKSPLPPLFVQTLYGASASVIDGAPNYFAHAPSTIAFALPAGAKAVQGGFGFRASAYAPDNKFPTDGAEFRVELVNERGERRRLFARLLQPLTEVQDRGVQSFAVSIPSGTPPGTRLEFVITPGPRDNAASDWTFWTDLRLETSR